MSKLRQLELKSKVLKLDPYKIVSAELDSFCPYMCVTLPKELVDLRNSLGDELEEEFEEWLSLIYLDYLQDCGAHTTVEKLTEIVEQELLDASVNLILLKE